MVKTSESESTLTKTIKENYLLKYENKKLQERITVLDNVIRRYSRNETMTKIMKIRGKSRKRQRLVITITNIKGKVHILRQRTLLNYPLMKHRMIMSQKMR